ncbi:hypothetical protein Scani_18350 [Streptomyces caniferus]|uniref:Uncharacterized protein n=1 Tax=Streptomyces caniferus TaxID=285557 RepID=A0A640S3L2_9ACTN|nr:hypothetical protein Scani_18350 [Streptomyces caniferus]
MQPWQHRDFGLGLVLMADLEDSEFHLQASEEEVALMSAVLEREDSCPQSATDGDDGCR